MKMKFTADIIIGTEVHVQLNTNTKLFCSCATKGEDIPNSRCCEICLGMPGSKPLVNQKAIEYALKLALALHCKINPDVIFSRKVYFYPDLAKNYQITQFEVPLGENGCIILDSGRKVKIERIHLEEDPASLIHPAGMEKSQYTLIDYNRSGIPLCEIVTAPEMHSPEEAREFMNKLKIILQYLKIFDENVCVIKADANISIKESGYIRSEIKNITGFKEIEDALLYEIQRQKKAIKDNEKLIQDTRGWNPDNKTTIRLRTKETEADYGYIIDPDLVKIDITEKFVKDIQKEMPELPEQKIHKFIHTHKINEQDAKILAAEYILAELFEQIAVEVSPQLAAKWLRRELIRVVNYNKMNFSQLKIDVKHLIELFSMIEKKEITETVGQDIMNQLIIKQFSPKEYVEKNNLKTVQDIAQLESLCKEIISKNAQVAQDYKNGKQEALHFLIGQVMRQMKGKADAKALKEMFEKMIKDE
ncbi:Asp-tRNA(Asn)/Glu-tRNA(Gln) amidotransferase subunit GatB [Candidatus Woesearchaeota archaeon]|nr:Asp-tRNA(Asn)/Glu-tRNA(Gln) amidotransferase subunit GatB [Candidatus Woesearchaeota archaeon]